MKPGLFSDVDLLARLWRLGGEIAERDDDPLRIDSTEEIGRDFAVGSLGVIELQKTCDGVRQAPRDDLHHLTPETCALLVDAAPEVELVHWVGDSVDVLDRAVPANIGNMVLTAGIGAPADLDGGGGQSARARHVR